MIHYIVAVYTGSRRNLEINEKLSDPLYLVKKHVDALNRLNVENITKATFVVAPSDDHKRDAEVIDYVKNVRIKDHIQIDSYLRRENKMLSYGSWDDVMKNNIHGNEHFFLIEDDYFPHRDYFYVPFLHTMKKHNFAYVCQLWTDKFFGIHCAAISNGLMNISACREHYSKFNECLSLSNTSRSNNNTYQQGVQAQTDFLQGYAGMGFSISDVSSNYAQPFLQPDNRIFMYGNDKGDVLIECEGYDEIKAEPAIYIRYKSVKGKKQ